MLPFRHPGMDIVEGLILLIHKRLVLINFEKKAFCFQRAILIAIEYQLS